MSGEKEVRTKLKFREIWIKRGPGRRAQYGRLTGEIARSGGKVVFWAERSKQGGVVPLLREEFVLKRADRGVKFTSVESTRSVKNGKVTDRGRT